MASSKRNRRASTGSGPSRLPSICHAMVGARRLIRQVFAYMGAPLQRLGLAIRRARPGSTRDPAEAMHTLCKNLPIGATAELRDDDDARPCLRRRRRRWSPRGSEAPLDRPLSLERELSAVIVASLAAFPVGAALAVTHFPGRQALIVLVNALLGLPGRRRRARDLPAAVARRTARLVRHPVHACRDGDRAGRARLPADRSTRAPGGRGRVARLSRAIPVARRDAVALGRRAAARPAPSRW